MCLVDFDLLQVHEDLADRYRALGLTGPDLDRAIVEALPRPEGRKVVISCPEGHTCKKAPPFKTKLTTTRSR